MEEQEIEITMMERIRAILVCMLVIFFVSFVSAILQRNDLIDRMNKCVKEHNLEYCNETVK